MKTMEKLVTLAIPEHDISHSVEKPFAGESHFLCDNYPIFLRENNAGKGGIFKNLNAECAKVYAKIAES